ncbi:MAG: glycoside hydrolase family 15 protein [Candidatus Paceibacterota bacterium]
MSRSLALGNGNILVCLDNKGQVRDFYFPHVGLENHVGGIFVHRIGVFADGKMRWFDHPSWNVTVLCADEALSGVITATNDELQVSVLITDVVYNEKNIYLRKIEVKNNSNIEREIKLFMNQEFELYESHHGDTAYFNPDTHSIIHYKGRRLFLINAKVDDKSFDDYTTGIFNAAGKEGSFKDTEDGKLSKNPIEHGRTDSVIGITLKLPGHSLKIVYYWVCVSKIFKELVALNNYVLERTPEHLLTTTYDFWKAWIKKYNFKFLKLSDEVVTLFKKSLFYIRAHADIDGGIIASGDGEIIRNDQDTYEYIWMRDASIAAMALDMAGDSSVSKRYFEFCNSTIFDGGYFMHKYRPDKSLGSSWHPWIKNNKMQLPIQEDETAIVIVALWKHYQVSRDLEFIEAIYNSLIKNSAMFLIQFRDIKTGLPNPSYDLWEEKFGIHTYTCASVYAALKSAANFAQILGKESDQNLFNNVAEDIKDSILKYLYDEKKNIFCKSMIISDNGEITYDYTLDTSSIFGIYFFEVLPADDPRVTKNVKKVLETLQSKTVGVGVARYEGDKYFGSNDSTPSNSWFITTLWIAQYYIAITKKESDLKKVREILEWASKYAQKSGVLSEQINPNTGEQLSVAPLTWSHAEFVVTTIKYLDKLNDLGLCGDCNPVKFNL